MSDRELGILVRAKGALQAAADIGKVDKSVGNLNQTASRTGKFALAGIGAAGIVAGGFITKGVMDGIASLELLEQATNQTNAVITSTGGAAGVSAEQVRKYAEQLETVTTADDKLIQGGENLLLTFTNIGSDVFPAATKAMVDMSIAMAQGDVENADFKASAIQIGKALNDPIRGMTALRKVGVSFTKQQEDQVEALVKSGKTVDAQKLILAELEKEFGKAGEAAGKGFGADMRRVKDSIEDAEAALATGFLPVISEVSKILSTELAKPETIAGIKEFGKGLAGGLSNLIEIARGLPWSSVGDALKVGGQGAKAVLDAFLGMPAWVQTAIITGWGLNKLTGGAVGSIVGELGKGLIKGVLGMNAGVVNINAGVVNGAGGAPVPGGGGGFLGTLRDAFAFVSGLAIAEAAGVAVREVMDQIGGKDTVGPALGPDGTIAQRQAAESLRNIEAKVGGLSLEERDVRAATNRVYDAIERKRLSVTVQNTNKVSISSRDVVSTTTLTKVLAGGIQQI